MSWVDAIYQYDGTYEGFLCCVFESYTQKESPIGFCVDEEFFTFYPVTQIHTLPQHARRVQRSIDKVSTRAAWILRRAFFTCLEEKELHLYNFIKKLYESGPNFLKNVSDPIYYPIHKALRHMDGELEKLRGFVRFSDYGGTLGAEIEPKNQVLPFLRHHFCNRYANESFFIYDRTNRQMLMYSHGTSRIVPVDALYLSAPGAEEIEYRRLWKRFFETVAIQERENPRCQNTFLPKRYRTTMTEFLPEEQGFGATIPATAHEDG